MAKQESNMKWIVVAAVVLGGIYLINSANEQSAAEQRQKEAQAQAQAAADAKARNAEYLKGCLAQVPEYAGQMASITQAGIAKCNAEYPTN